MQLKQGLGLRSYWGPTRIIYLNIFIQNHLYAGLGHYAASTLKIVINCTIDPPSDLFYRKQLLRR